MAPEKLNPPAGGARRALECIAVSANVPEHITALPSLQQLRVRVLARRFGLTPEIAAAVAEIAFETREARL